MAKFRIVDGADEIGWLLARAEQEALNTGLEVPGFEARALILHAMWEHPQGAGLDSFDAAHRAAVAAGEIEPHMVGDVNLSERTVATGVPGGATSKPPGWTRLRWSELAVRWGSQLVLDLSVDPISGFRPRLQSGSWPVGIQPPPQGALDWESLVRLIDHLRSRTGSQNVYNYSAPGAWYGEHAQSGSPPLAVVRLEGMLDLYGDSGSFGSGQNWWPADRSWLVYSDWDLSCSVVQGSASLISDLLGDSELEVVRLDPL